MASIKYNVMYGLIYIGILRLVFQNVLFKPINNVRFHWILYCRDPCYSDHMRIISVRFWAQTKTFFESRIEVLVYNYNPPLPATYHRCNRGSFFIVQSCTIGQNPSNTRTTARYAFSAGSTYAARSREHQEKRCPHIQSMYIYIYSTKYIQHTPIGYESIEYIWAPKNPSMCKSPRLLCRTLMLLCTYILMAIRSFFAGLT